MPLVLVGLVWSVLRYKPASRQLHVQNIPGFLQRTLDSHGRLISQMWCVTATPWKFIFISFSARQWTPTHERMQSQADVDEVLYLWSCGFSVCQVVSCFSTGCFCESHLSRKHSWEYLTVSQLVPWPRTFSPPEGLCEECIWRNHSSNHLEMNWIWIPDAYIGCGAIRTGHDRLWQHAIFDKVRLYPVFSFMQEMLAVLVLYG